MNATVSLVLTLAPLPVAAFALVWAIVKRPMGMIHLVALAVLEVGLLVQVVVAVVTMVGGGRPDGGMVTFVFYLVGSLVVLPVGALWGIADRSKWGSVVVAVACLVVPVLVARMNQVWAG